MKILQIVQKPQLRGAEIFAFELNRQLEEYGCETRTLYLYEYHGSQRLPVKDKDVCLKATHNNPFESSIGFNPHLLYSSYRTMREFAPDIIQLNGSRTVKYGALARFVGDGDFNAKLVYRVIDMPSFWNKKWWSVNVFRKLIIPQIDGLIAVSSPSLADAKSLYDIRVPAEVILNGIDPKKLQGARHRSAFRAEMGASEDDVVLLFLNSLVPQKRPDRFIRVFRAVREEVSNVKAWVVGDGALRREVENLARKASLLEDCRFFGYQSEVAAYLNGADMVVLTSDSEGSPAVVLEAGYLERAVVATDVGGISESLIDGETGILVDVNREEDMIKSIVYLSSNREAREEMGRKSGKRIRSFFTIDRIAQRYLEFYKRIVGQSEIGQPIEQPLTPTP